MLEELGLSYHSIYLDLQKGEQKNAEHTKFNANGRIPTLIDHANGDFTIWESNAILLYLVDRYDKDKKLTSTNDDERHAIVQWLFFQASGQGYVCTLYGPSITSIQRVLTAEYADRTSARRSGS